MPYKFNGITNKLDLVDITSGGPGVGTLTGNSGGAVGPDGSSNINVVGTGSVLVTGNPGTNTLTISNSDEGVVWSSISASQTLAIGNGYFCTGGGALSLLLPPVSDQGDTIEITLDGSTSFTVTQGAGQQIRLANTTTTSGATGSMASTQQGDYVRLVCKTANLAWNCLGSDGNLTLV